MEQYDARGQKEARRNTISVLLLKLDKLLLDFEFSDHELTSEEKRSLVSKIKHACLYRLKEMPLSGQKDLIPLLTQIRDLDFDDTLAVKDVYLKLMKVKDVTVGYALQYDRMVRKRRKLKEDFKAHLRALERFRKLFS